MFKDRYILATIITAIVTLQAAIWPIALKSSDLPDIVIFWHTLPPADRLASVEYLWFLPGVAAAFLIINTAAAYGMHRRHPSIAQLLTTVSAAICLLAAVSIIKTILIYTSLI